MIEQEHIPKIYYKGNKKRGNEIISTLEKLGGVNRGNYNGENECALYYIDELGEIEENVEYYSNHMVSAYYTEISLPINEF